MTSLTDTQVVTASGGLVELGYGETDAAATITATSSASMHNLSPEVTVVCDGSPVIVEFYAPIARATQDAAGTGDQLNFVLQYDGAVQEDSWGRVANRSTAIGHLVPVFLQYRMTPTSGSHTFRVGGYVSNASRNGYVGAGTPYPPMFLRVSKVVQATQWPAVTTGTIICTSSTRPASPFEGQQIYETDTKKEMTYDGAGWYAFNQVIGYASSTSSFSTSATHTTLQDNGLTTGSIPYADNRRIRVTLYARPYPNGGLQRMEFRVLAGSDTAGYWALGTTGLSASEAPYKCMTNVWTTTSSGSAVFKAQVKASVSNTQVTDYYSVSDGLARSLTIEDIGPA